MGRWTQYDEDEYRLPEGMKRVGYDADTQKYTYSDRGGNVWQGAEGAEFGELRLTGAKISQARDSGSDLEASVGGAKNGGSSGSDEEGAIHQFQSDSGDNPQSRSAYKALLPFFLIVLVVLLLVARLVGSPFILSPKPHQCGEHSRVYKVKSGDSCWKISQSQGTTLDELRTVNPGVDCARLMPGQKMCIPVRE